MKKTIVIVLLGMATVFIPDHGFAADWSAMTSGTTHNLNVGDGLRGHHRMILSRKK